MDHCSLVCEHIHFFNTRNNCLPLTSLRRTEVFYHLLSCSMNHLLLFGSSSFPTNVHLCFSLASFSWFMIISFILLERKWERKGLGLALRGSQGDQLRLGAHTWGHKIHTFSFRFYFFRVEVFLIDPLGTILHYKCTTET